MSLCWGKSMSFSTSLDSRLSDSFAVWNAGVYWRSEDTPPAVLCSQCECSWCCSSSLCLYLFLSASVPVYLFLFLSSLPKTLVLLTYRTNLDLGLGFTDSNLVFNCGNRNKRKQSLLDWGELMLCLTKSCTYSLRQHPEAKCINPKTLKTQCAC